MKVALKAAVDAGQWERVRVLTELLATPPKAGTAVDLVGRRKAGDPS